ncbi:MAG: hypothetical protein K0S37_4205 [Microbacterium sp.]|jgi:hypothetical protein|nr:hypothetical protein [Microbacterium sp.]
MSASGQVGRVAQDAVGAPYDQVRDARFDRATATGAPILFLRLRHRKGLNGPLGAALDLDALPPRDQAIEGVIAAIPVGTTLV